MAFNHDNFIASQNYLDLDASLDWYIATVKSKAEFLLLLRDQDKRLEDGTSAFKALYDQDPVLRKLRKISRFIEGFTSHLEPEA